MFDSAPDLVLTQLKHFAEQQKKLNRQLMMYRVWFVVASAFLILSVGKSYKNLHGANAEYLYFTMNIVFLLSFCLKYRFWKNQLFYQTTQSETETFLNFFKQHLANQQRLVISYLATFIILIGVGLIFFLLYIPNTSLLFWIIITPVSMVLFVFGGLFIFRIEQIKSAINRKFPEYLYS